MTVAILVVTVHDSLLTPAGRSNGRLLKVREHAEVDDVHDEIEANRDDLDPEDENLLEKARSTRLR